MVSFYEEHIVRVEAGYKLREWYQLSPQERAFEVAHWRLRGLVKTHTDLFVMKHQKHK